MVKEHYNDGTLCLLEPGIIPKIKDAIEKFDPLMVIELGTYYGGLTKYLMEWCHDTPIYTFDIVNMVSNKDAKLFRNNGNVIQIITNVFINNGFIFNLLTLPLRKFFMCDNGCKKEEVAMFAGALLPGDLLGIHDYGSEVFYDDVKHVLNEFDEHELNKEFSIPGVSEFRLFHRKGRVGRSALPNDYKEKL